MKVILLRDVAKIGKRNEVKEVPSGYALNMLIPRKMALIASPENLKKIAQVHASQAKSSEYHEAQFDDALAKLGAAPLELRIEANAQGSLFKAVRPEDVVSAAKSVDAVIEAAQVVLDEPIKHVGAHTIALKSGKKTGTFVLEVTAK